MGAVEEAVWGSVNSLPVYLYTLNGATGAAAQITNYGATLQSLKIPGPDGELIDVVLGFDNFHEYQGEHPFFGATIGRCANRIAGGSFNLDGRIHKLAINDNSGPNHIHGGVVGFDKQVWKTSDFGQNGEGAYVKLTYTSPGGEEGYPGSVEATVIYTLNNNELHITMAAETDSLTLVNLTNHSYWNLNGHQAGSVLKHNITLFSDAYTPVDKHLIPTGEIRAVAGTAFDFTQHREIGSAMGTIPKSGHNEPAGYDHNFVLRDAGGRTRPAARVESDESGLIMEVRTNQPSVQFYTANFLTQDLPGKHGAAYSKHHAFCLETQTFPDAINHQELGGWPSVLLPPGKCYHHKVCYAFSDDGTGL